LIVVEYAFLVAISINLTTLPAERALRPYTI